jgi:hypothetical protein
LEEENPERAQWGFCFEEERERERERERETERENKHFKFIECSPYIS